MVKKITGILFLTLATVSLFGQQHYLPIQPSVDAVLNSIVPPSPNASSLGKYGEYQTDLFTGLPNISVPLMTIKDQDLQVPISLSYHASGIKVDEIASWVGLGWSLNAGGVITRTVRGSADDDQGLGYWYYGQTYINGINGVNGAIPSTYIQAAYKFHYDLQPDEYYYNIGSSSGKFLVGWDMTCHPVPYSNIKIEIIPTSGSETFKITDGNGTVYYFNDEETTHSSDASGNEQFFTSSWYMSKIVSVQHNATITFSYTDYDHIVPIQLQYTNYQLSNSCIFCGGSYEVNSTSSPEYMGKRLSSINWADGKIVFTPQAAPRLDLTADNALDNIQSFNTDNRPISQFKFDYGYTSNRLMLNTITEVSTLGSTKPPYIFRYDAGELPDRFSHGIDHWGYANGTSNLQNLIPFQSDAGFFPNGGNREPLLNATRAQTLVQITYPTGGNTIFDYENNLYGYNESGAINDTLPVVIQQLAKKQVTQAGKGGSVDDSFQFTIDHRQVITVSRNKLITFTPPSTGTPGDIAIASFGFSPPAQLYTGIGGTLIPLQTGYPVQEFTNYFIADPGTYTVFLSLNSESAVWEEETVSVGYTMNTNQKITIKNKVGPGLRIKTVTTNDGVNSTQKITNYKYTEPNEPDRSTGHLISSPIYTVNPITRYESAQNPNTIPGGPPAGCSFIIVGSDGGGTKQYQLECHYLPFTNENHAFLGTSHGRNVVYPLVTEQQMLNGTPNGTTVSQFSFIGPVPVAQEKYPFTPIAYKDYKNGLLIDKTIYNVAGQKISEEVNNYKTDISVNAYRQQGVVIQQVISGRTILKNGNIPATDFVDKSYFPASEWVTLQSSVKRLFNPANQGQKVETVTNFVYGNPVHANVTEKHTTESDASTRIDYTRYPLDILPNGNTGNGILNMMNNLHITDVPLEQYSTIDRVGSATQCTSGSLTSYRQNGVFVAKDKQYTLSFSGGTFTPITNYQLATNPGNSLLFDSRYEATDKFNKYDAANNLTELADRDNTYAFIRNPANGDVWAKVIHASISDIAYTGFEHGVVPSTAFTNWTYNTAGISIGSGQSGSNSFTISSAYTISTALTLNRSKTYRISFWAQSSSITVNNGSVTLRTGPTRTVNNISWTYYEGTASNITALQVGGSGTIDELRLAPIDAKMVSYTYINGIGIISQCNENNQTTYWEYDDFNRLKLTRDQDGNILKKNEYQYQQPTY
jgi:hypothetical protein